MPNRITVILGGKPYTLITDECDETVYRAAAYADKKYTEQKHNLRSELDAAVMALLVVSDEYLKANERAENARSQIQSCLEDATKARLESAELRRELTRFKK